MSVYLELFHGRDDPEQDMDDWGFQGPAIGPLDFVHVTYGEGPRLLAKHGEMECWLQKHEDMIAFRGKYYGDWAVVSETKHEEIITPAQMTDADTGNRQPNRGDPMADGPGSYTVAFDDEDFAAPHLYCSACVGGIEGLLEDCKCDPNDRDGNCICIVDCNPKFRIRKTMVVRSTDRCVSCCKTRVRL